MLPPLNTPPATRTSNSCGNTSTCAVFSAEETKNVEASRAATHRQNRVSRIEFTRRAFILILLLLANARWQLWKRTKQQHERQCTAPACGVSSFSANALEKLRQKDWRRVKILRQNFVSQVPCQQFYKPGGCDSAKPRSGAYRGENSQGMRKQIGRMRAPGKLNSHAFRISTFT